MSSIILCLASQIRSAFRNRLSVEVEFEVEFEVEVDVEFEWLAVLRLRGPNQWFLLYPGALPPLLRWGAEENAV